MKYSNKIVGLFLLTILAFANLACQTQQATNVNGGGNAGATTSVSNVKAQSPTEAYKLLYAACKAKDIPTIRALMSKSSLGLAEFSASQQKKSVDKVLENGLVAPTLADTLSEIRDERIKDNYGAVEVFNPKDNRWEDLPFVLEDGGWKVAVGDLFQDTFKSPGKSKAQLANEASNTNAMPPAKTTNFPAMNGNSKIADKDKSVEVPKDDKPKK